MNHIVKTVLIGTTALTMTACSAVDRISDIGAKPEVTQIENPTLRQDYRPVSLPMPTPEVVVKQPNSLWASNRRNFFKDQRASQVGDILTVTIDIADEAQLDNESSRSRNSSESAGLGGFLGYEDSLDRVLPEAVDNENLVEGGADSEFQGTGSIEREEEITLRLAALVTQILPNGNLVIHGKQEVAVNYEKRIIAIDGVIRPEDVTIANTISYEKIAEARIAYGGEGDLTEVQQPRYGQQLYDVIFPF